LYPCLAFLPCRIMNSTLLLQIVDRCYGQVYLFGTSTVALLNSPLVQDLKKDLHPLRWTSKYRRTTVLYLIIVSLFYKVIGAIALVGSLYLLQLFGFNYSENLSFYVTNYNTAFVLFAGPTEETLFFGIPLYSTSNHVVVMATGILWLVSHLLNSSSIQLNTLAYPQFFGLIPSLFWSFRTWISGKGWFAIISHSMYNLSSITPSCLSGELPCHDNLYSVLGLAIIACLLLGINYSLYRRRARKLKVKYKIAIITILSIIYILGFFFSIILSQSHP
jgi:hypothetical protein